MKNVSKPSFIIILVVSAAFLFFFTNESPVSTEIISSTWSEPEILFMLPDSVDGSRYLSAHVDNGEITLLSNYIRRTPDLHALEFSYMIRTNISENGSISEEILSDTNYPAEGSALLHHSNNGEWHTLWGERREDPDFEMWETSLPRINLFSTSLMYRGVGIDETENSIEILDAGLLPDGGGAIRPPSFSIKIDESNNLHVVLQAWKFLEETGGVMPFITYLRKKNNLPWEDARFPIINEDGFSRGVEGTIETHIRDRLIIAFLGAAPGEQQGSNNILIVTSDDNGDTWSEPKAVFPSGTQSAKLLRLYKDKQDRLHLLWGRQIEGLPIPDEMWHSLSEDGGDTWTNPERFFIMEKPPGVSENGIIDYDVVSDSFGCIHWVANIYELRSSNSTSMNEAPGIYVRWCLLNKQWQPEPLSELPGGVTFVPATDEEEQKLYLFWTNEVSEGDQLAMFYSVKDLTEPVLPPEIAKSGPLLLHSNYPNPFNPSTRISFTLEEPAEVVLTIYDISGRQIMQKDLGTKQAGFHAEEVNLAGLTSGTYIYEVELNNTWRQQSTMMLIK